jgi:hypothetical protein
MAALKTKAVRGREHFPIEVVRAVARCKGGKRIGNDSTR